jgi:hypothetical protein
MAGGQHLAQVLAANWARISGKNTSRNRPHNLPKIRPHI